MGARGAAMTPQQLPLMARVVPTHNAHGSGPLDVPADALCVLAPGWDAARDADVPEGASGGGVWVREHQIAGHA